MSKSIAVFAGHDDDTWDELRSKGIYTELEADGEYEEYDTNIIIASYTVAILRQVEGLTVYFPQEHGRDMTLKERVDFCNDHNVDTAMFMHSNASASRTAEGTAAFYWDGSEDGLRFANIYREEMSRFGFPLWSNGTYPCSHSQTHWSNFYVVEHTNMPVILLENFFFTNPYELKNYLLNPTNRDKIIEAQARTACRYLGLKYPNIKTEINKEDDDMLEQAIVVNAFGDTFAAEPLAKRLQCPIYFRDTAEQIEVAKTIYVCGGSKQGLKGSKFVELTGLDRWEAAEAIGNYTKKI